MVKFLTVKCPKIFPNTTVCKRCATDHGFRLELQREGNTGRKFIHSLKELTRFLPKWKIAMNKQTLYPYKNTHFTVLTRLYDVYKTAQNNVYEWRKPKCQTLVFSDDRRIFILVALGISGSSSTKRWLEWAKTGPEVAPGLMTSMRSWVAGIDSDH